MTNNDLKILEIKANFKELENLTIKLRKETRELMGGIAFKKEFGIYTMNIPNNEAFFNYLEKHFTEAEKLLMCYKETMEIKNDK